MDYVLRLQALDGYQAKFQTVFGDRFSRIIAAHHTGKKRDNPHYHFCFTTDYRKDALRKYLKKHFDLATGNKHLSLKEWDGNPKACSYLFHEGCDTPIFNRGFSEQDIKDFKDMNDLIQSNMIKPNMIVDKCVEHFKHGNEHKMINLPDKKDIFTYMMGVYKHNGEWLPNKFQAERVINKIRSELCDNPQAERVLWNTMYNEYFPYG